MKILLMFSGFHDNMTFRFINYIELPVKIWIQEEMIWRRIKNSDRKLITNSKDMMHKGLENGSAKTGKDALEDNQRDGWMISLD